MKTATDIATEWVDADIAAGILAPAKRAERIALRALRYFIVVVRDGDICTNNWMVVGLAYGDGTNEHAVDDWDGAFRFRDQDPGDPAEFVRSAVAELRARHGDLPVRANRFARHFITGIENARSTWDRRPD